MNPIPFSKRTRAARLHRTWVKARRAQREHLAIVHPDGAIDCVCERSVWYFAKRKALGHRHHCEICHPRYRNGSTRTRVKHFMMSSGLLPQNRQLKTAFYR
jgi:ribosomal protein L19E